MQRKKIPIKVERLLYAESMGRCMNPSCNKVVISSTGDISEKAHIVEYSSTKDHDFNNLIILCPNCHTDFDKNNKFTKEEVKSWKDNRREIVSRLFERRFPNFESLKSELLPYFIENKMLFEKYYIRGSIEQWILVETKIITNNEYIKLILENNLNIFQRLDNEDYSNLHQIKQLIAHINEFKNTRGNIEKARSIIYPKEVDSIFGITPIDSNDYFENVASIEALMDLGIVRKCVLGIVKPYLILNDDTKILLSDSPRLRQLCHDNNAFRSMNVRLKSLNFALAYILKQGKSFYHIDNSLTVIKLKDYKIKFVYEYCLSQQYIYSLDDIDFDIIVNLHKWNGMGAISADAHKLASKLGIKLYTMDDFYGFVKEV